MLCIQCTERHSNFCAPGTVVQETALQISPNALGAIEAAAHAIRAADQLVRDTDRCSHLKHHTMLHREVHRASLFGQHVVQREEDAAILVRVAARLDRIAREQDSDEWEALTVHDALTAMKDVNQSLRVADVNPISVKFALEAEADKMMPYITECPLYHQNTLVTVKALQAEAAILAQMGRWVMLA